MSDNSNPHPTPEVVQMLRGAQTVVDNPNSPESLMIRLRWSQEPRFQEWLQRLRPSHEDVSPLKQHLMNKGWIH